jgi:hypothetical protein
VSNATRGNYANNWDLLSNRTIVVNVPLVKDTLADIYDALGQDQICFTRRHVSHERFYPNRYEVVSLSALNSYLYRERDAFDTAEKVMQNFNYMGVCNVIKPIKEFGRIHDNNLISVVAVGGRARCVNYWALFSAGSKTGAWLWLCLRRKQVADRPFSKTVEEARKRRAALALEGEPVPQDERHYWCFEPDVTIVNSAPMDCDYAIPVGMTSFVEGSMRNRAKLHNFTFAKDAGDRRGQTNNLPTVDILLQ